MTRNPGDPLCDDAPDRTGHAPFTRVRLREGYAMPQVDAFIARAVADLSSPAPTLSAADVRRVRFTPVRLREGYDMAEVDSYLDELEQRVADHCSGDEDDLEDSASTRRPRTPPVWVGRLKWVLLVLVVVVWLYATVFPSR